MQLVCEECRDWPITKRKIFVNYNNKLRSKREYKQRQARLAGAASDQSVYDTDTDVPLDEPSVPVPNVHLDELNVGQQQCLISEEVVVPRGPSTETATSELLLLPRGSDLDKLALTILSRLSDLQSARGPQTPIQSQSMTSGVSQQAVILPNVCQPSVQAASGISQPGVILPNVCQPVFTNTEVAGVTAPPPLFPNPAQPVFKLPTALISGETHHRPVNSDEGVWHLQEALSSTNQAIASLRASGIRPLQSLLDSDPSLARKLQDARLSSSRPGVSSSAKPRSPQVGPNRPETTQMGPTRPETTQMGPDRPESTQWVLVAQSSTLLPLVRLGDCLLTRLSVPRTTHLARGVILPLAKGVGTLEIHLTRTHRPRIASNGTINRTKRIILVLPPWTFC